MSASPPFKILTVCTGNICRSPMVERVLQRELNLITPGAYQVVSAGTGALVGSAMEPHIEGFVRVLGASTHGFAARQLTSNILREQDLVLALTRKHRSRIVELNPALLRKTFTLRELARILPEVETPRSADVAERWASVIPLALRARSMRGHDPEDDDVVDPYHHSDEVYEQMREEITPAIQVILDWERKHTHGLRRRRPRLDEEAVTQIREASAPTTLRSKPRTTDASNGMAHIPSEAARWPGTISGN